MNQRCLCAIVICTTALLSGYGHAAPADATKDVLPDHAPDSVVVSVLSDAGDDTQRADPRRSGADAPPPDKTDLSMDLSNQVVLIPVPPALVLGAVGLAGVIWKRRTIIQSLR